jgi:drug/metabolite transporter (DMT)-like permease
MVVGIAAGLAAGALWGLVFVAPRMVGHFGMVDITAARFVVFGAVAALAVQARPARQRWPSGGRRDFACRPCCPDCC